MVSVLESSKRLHKAMGASRSPKRHRSIHVSPTLSNSLVSSMGQGAGSAFCPLKCFRPPKLMSPDFSSGLPHSRLHPPSTQQESPSGLTT